ncbi:hypothetical protein cypCar_00034979 [Cyprinus carpio]|nr:hypothetical protein cypCar_00034979 [Cyprinus carpio]
MSSEEFEKLHEMYSSLYEEVKLMPERAQRCQGEERKRIVRDFEERVSEAEEVLIHTGENLSRSRKILRAMSRRLVTNKLLLSVIIIMELAILAGVVYLKFFRKK